MTLKCWNLWRGVNGFRFDLKQTGFLFERKVRLDKAVKGFMSIAA